MTDKNIPVVDLSSSQEDDESLGRGGAGKRKEVVNIVDHVSPKKQRLSQISRSDFEGLHQRLSLVENLVTREANSSNKEPTREEFNKLEARVSRMESRLESIEQFIQNVSTFFQGITFPSQPAHNDSDLANGQESCYNSPTTTNSAQTSRSTSAHAVPSPPTIPVRTTPAHAVPSPPTIPVRTTPAHAVPSPPTIPVRTTPAHERRASGKTSATPKKSTERPSHSAILKAGTPSATTSSLTIKPVAAAGQSGTTTPRMTKNNNLGRAVTITPVPITSAKRTQGTPEQAQARGNTNINQNITPSGSGIGKKQSLSTQHTPANLAQLTHEAQDLNDNEEVADHFYANIPIKMELFDVSHAPARRDILSLYKDLENRYYVYVRGEARKVRNKDIYMAVYGWSLGGNRTWCVPYKSEIQTPVVRKQAEILAALLAVEYLKQNSGETGPLMITIVSNHIKIIQIMTNVRSIYRNMDICACTVYPCGHIGRWDTHDSFAKNFPDDFPKLVLATKDIDVRWRTYQLPMDAIYDNELKTKLRQALKDSPKQL